MTTEPVTAAQLHGALAGDEDPAGAEVMVVAPAVHESALRFWLSDADEAIARADAVRRASLDRLGDAGVAASAESGDSDPERAIEDALATFAADRILVLTHAEGERRYREAIDPEVLRRRFEIPVTEAVARS